jgi:hypothetical protein
MRLMSNETTVDNDRDLSLAAVGLWHKLQAINGDVCDKADLLTIEPSPNAWGPGSALLEDIESALDQLTAIGYVEEETGAKLRLHFDRV